MIVTHVNFLARMGTNAKIVPLEQNLKSDAVNLTCIYFLTHNFFKWYMVYMLNKTKDWALVQTAALAINQGFNVRLG